MQLLMVLLLASLTAYGSDTTVIFNGSLPSKRPFPSDLLTVPDSLQKTGLRVMLPTTDCLTDSAQLSCINADLTGLVNQFDGFNPNTRAKVCFSDAIDPSTVSGAMGFYPVNGDPSVPVNQVTFDPKTNCVFVKPDVILSQSSRYLLAVTDGLRDSAGHTVKQDDDFRYCLKNGSDDYCRDLQIAVKQINGSKKVVGGSLFTTMSATSWLEKARDKVNGPFTPELVIPAGFPYVFPVSKIKKFTWIPDSSPIGPQDVPVSVLQGVDSIAFGLYLSPNFLLYPSSDPKVIPGTIAPRATNLPITEPNAYVPVSFHVFLPKKCAVSGCPVVIYGHGAGDNQFGAPTYMASTLANAGFATVAIEIFGHGFGPNGSVQITDYSDNTNKVATPGRGVSLGGPVIGPTDGCIVGGPYGFRDCLRQTAVDLIAFTRTLRDFGGFGLGLDPSHVYYVGQSLGSLYGTLFHATDTRVRAAVINAGGGPQTDISRLAVSARLLGTGFLYSTNPFLLNVAIPQPSIPLAPAQAPFFDSFNDNYPYRNRITINNISGATQVQDAFELAEWIDMPGDALAFGSSLQSRPTAFQFGIGDLEVPNPTESALVRAAQGQANTSLFRFDTAAKIDPSLLTISMPGAPQILPHRVLSNPTIFLPQYSDELSIALAEQKQAAAFFSSDGKALPSANDYLQGIFAGIKLFEKPTVLPDDLNNPLPK